MPYYQTLLSLLGFEKLRDYVWSDGDGFYFQFNQANPETNDYQRYAAGMNHLGFSASSVEMVKSIQQ